MRLVAFAVLAILLASPASAQSICATTEEDFIASAVRVNQAKVLVANDKAREVILAKINNARLSAKLWAFEADKLSIGVISHDNQLLVGIVMFKDACVVPGTVKIVAAHDWIAFLLELGLSMDDFKPEQGA
jgi:hypothetical protein